MTNDFHVSYLRNQWQWSTNGAPPQLPGLAGAVETGGESTNALIPYNVDSQDVRQRQWDGHDWLFRDDVNHAARQSPVPVRRVVSARLRLLHAQRQRNRDRRGAGLSNRQR